MKSRQATEAVLEPTVAVLPYCKLTLLSSEQHICVVVNNPFEQRISFIDPL